MSMKKGLFKVFSTKATVGWEDVDSVCRWQLTTTRQNRVASITTRDLDRKSGSAGMPRSTLFPYTTLFRSVFSTKATVGWEDVDSVCRWQLTTTRQNRVASITTRD